MEPKRPQLSGMERKRVGLLAPHLTPLRMFCGVFTGCEIETENPNKPRSFTFLSTIILFLTTRLVTEQLEPFHRTSCAVRRENAALWLSSREFASKSERLYSERIFSPEMSGSHPEPAWGGNRNGPELSRMKRKSVLKLSP